MRVDGQRGERLGGGGRSRRPSAPARRHPPRLRVALASDRCPLRTGLAELRVELAEDRRGLRQGEADLDRGGLPARLLAGVVAGQDRVDPAGDVQIRTSTSSGWAPHTPVPAQRLVRLLRSVRQEWREQRVSVLPTCSAMCSTASRLPGSSPSFHGSCSDRYRLAAETTRIASPMPARNRERLRCHRPCRTPRVGARAVRRRPGPAWLQAGSHRCSCAPSRSTGRELPHSLASSKLTPPDELVPREVDVLRLGPGGRDEVPQAVRSVVAQEVLR